MSTTSAAADDGRMTPTRQSHARLAVAGAALVALALLTGACDSDGKPNAGAASGAAATSPPTAITTTTSAGDPNASAYCQTARKWMVHELGGEGDSFAADAAAFKKYWGDYLDYIATASRQAPAEIRDDWPVGHDFVVKQFTPILAKYDYDIARVKAEGTPVELAVGKRFDDGPNPVEQRAQDAVHQYEGTVCQTAQPPAADESFRGVTVIAAYCQAVLTANDAAGQVNAKKWTVDAVRAYATGAAYTTSLDQLEASAPAEIKADVVADTEWQRHQLVAVLEKFGYDVRKLFLEGSAADRATFQRSDPAVAGHYARTVGYEEQLCGA
jgi:hypothetical protein